MQWTLVLLCAPFLAGAGKTIRPFAIEVVDEQTGRGVPLVELRTTNDIRLFTDSNGIVAFAEPGWMDQQVFFHVQSHGYEFPKDGFGFRGRILDVAEGGQARLAIRRINIAERLYRVTGSGIYRDSLLVGRAVPVRQPVLNAQVTGCDSVQNAIYRGKIYWFWGDTGRPRYPLGNFHTPGATSEMPDRGGLDPTVGIDLEYFPGKDGFARPTAELPGQGPTWISGLTVLRDGAERERMFAHYVKVRSSPSVLFEVYERGLAEFDDSTKTFEKVATFPAEQPFPDGAHTFLHTVAGTTYVYHSDPYPFVRVRADPEHLKDQERYEVFTSIEAGSRDKGRFDRDDQGRLRYAWKANTASLSTREQAEAVRRGVISPQDDIMALRDAETGNTVVAHRGTVYRNRYRGRWVMIAGETPDLGEIWYAEADRPLGPWVYARKVVTHDRYSFYNPKHHPMFDQDGGRVIYFEGTYTVSFSGNTDKTPRYDYNQVMYRLDLSDPRLNLPVVVYEIGEDGVADRFKTGWKPGEPARPIAFWALERPGPQTLPVYETKTDEGNPTLEAGPLPEKALGESTAPVFHALRPDTASPPATTVPLYEFHHPESGRRAYATEDRSPPAPYRRSPRPMARVWRHPLRQMPLDWE